MDAVIVASVAFAVVFIAASLLGGKFGHALILAAVVAIVSALGRILRRKRGEGGE